MEKKTINKNLCLKINIITYEILVLITTKNNNNLITIYNNNNN